MRFIVIILQISLITANYEKIHQKRALQKSHEKPQWLKWSEVFLGKSKLDQQSYLVRLLKKITTEYLTDCTPVILYDTFTENYDNLLLEKLLTNFPVAYIHGQITEDYEMVIKTQDDFKPTCVSFMLFMKDVMKCRNVIGEQSNSKVVVVSRSSQWKVFEFLSHEESRSFVNLLVIVKSEHMLVNEEAPYILYTHRLYVDALGSSKAEVLTSYKKGQLTRNVTLFPKKMLHGFSGHRFIVAISHQPPYVIAKGRNNDGDKIFEGIEIRLVNLLSNMYNFTTDYRESTEDTVVGSSEAITRTIERNKVNLGIGGLYVTQDKINRMGMTQFHSRDCAAFVSLTSTALPRYRAIMGPFQWTVWLAITLIYLLGILPLAFSDKHTLTPLLRNPQEIENMFWYVFGTFTNCFTFTGKRSWSKSDKIATRLLIGFYWIFTIIITSCYTGSIIAFVTLPVYPAVVDTVNQLLTGRYQIGTLDKGEWPYLFANSSDPITEKLLKNLDLVPNIDSGLRNTTKSFFWNYAFLGSRAQLDYMVRTNFSTKSKRSVLHITAECFVPFNVALAYPKKSIYGEVFNDGIQKIIQAGLINKLEADVQWEMMRSSTGKFLAANSRTTSIQAITYEDRALTLDDTQGMFLLLGAGFLIAASSLISEWLGGCVNFCQRQRNRKDSFISSIESNPRSHERRTPRDTLNNIYYNAIRKKIENVNPVQVNQNRDRDQNTNYNITETDSMKDNLNEEIDRIFENVFGEENDNNAETKIE